MVENREVLALNLIKDFCISYYKNRSVDTSLNYLSDKIFWIGPSKNSQVSSIKELKIKFLLETAIIPSKFTIQSLYEHCFKITDDVYNICYNIKVYNKKKNIDFIVNIYSSVVFKQDSAKISSLKFDYTYPKDLRYTSYINGGILTAKFESKNYIAIKSFNKHFLNIFNLKEKDVKKMIDTNLFEYVHGGDIVLFKHQFFSDKSINTPHCYKCRIKFDEEYISTIITAVSNKENNELIYYMVIQPSSIDNNNINSNNNDNDKVTSEPLSTNKLINLGFINHENLFNEKYTITKVNEKFAQLLGYTQKELKKITKYDYFDIIYKEDREYVKNAYSKLKNSRSKKYIAYRFISKDKKVIWVKENLSLKNKKTKGLVIKAIIEEISYINNKENHQNPLLYQNEFDSKFLIVDIVNKNFETEIFKNSRIKFPNKYVNNLPNSLIEDNIIYKDDTKSFLDFSKNVQIKQKNNWIGRLNLKNNKIGWYQINSYTLFNNNMPIKALCLIININAVKNILIKFEKYQELLNIIISDYDFIGEYDSFSSQPLFMYSPVSQKDFIENNKENNLDYLIYNVIHKDYIHLLIDEKNKTLNNTFNGVIPNNNEYEIKYRSLSNRFKGYQWAKIKYVYHIDINTKHLNTIVLIKNINSSKEKNIY